MRIHAVRFFLIFSFIVAQFFMQQLHELTHLLSNESEPEIEALHAVNGSATASLQELHKHCKFLQLIANQHPQPFVVLDSSPQVHVLAIQNIRPTLIPYWISYSDSNYHQARAPPVV